MDSVEVFQSDLAWQTVPTGYEQFYGRTSWQPNPGSFGQSYNRFGPPGSQLQSSIPEYGQRPTLPGKARPMYGSALPENDRWPTSVLPRSERCPTLPGGDLSRYGSALPVYCNALPLNGGALPVNGKARQMSDSCPNGALWMNGSALPVNGSALLLNGHALPEYDIARQMNSTLPGNRQCPSMLGSALPRGVQCPTLSGFVRPRNDQYPFNGQNATFDQPGPCIHQQCQSGSIDGQPDRFEVQREGTSREVGERPGPDDPGEPKENGLTSRKKSAPSERNPRSPEKRHGR